MIALLLIPLALALTFGISSFADQQVEAEAERVAESNGLDDFDPDAPSIFDDINLELGSNESDTLTGTAANDILLSFGQTDVVRGLDGDDLIDGGTNDDTLIGGAGDDTLGGGSGSDRIVGDDGDDVLIGNAGDDQLLGRAGDDLLIGGGDQDTLNGGSGNDVLFSRFAGFGPQLEEQDISATAVRAIDVFGTGQFEDVDFTELEAQGAFNGVDLRFLEMQSSEGQGGTVIGGSGNDIMVLSGGDTATGGPGDDVFVLNSDMVAEQTVFIEDFSRQDDVITVQHTGTSPDVEVVDRGADAVVRIGQEVIARVVNGAGLNVADIRLIQTGA